VTPYVEIRDLRVTFGGGMRPVRAVSDVTLAIRPGEAVALIGESGSGKSVTMRSVLRLHPKSARIEGAISVGGRDVLAMDARALSAFRGGEAAMIFQEPLLALDPVYTVGQQIVETVRRHEGVSGAAARARALELFERVRIPSPARRLDAYPHEMSGGMRQRAMIALGTRPVDHLRHPRHRRGGRGRGPHRRDVWRPHRRGGHGARADPLAPPPLHARPAEKPRA